MCVSSHKILICAGESYIKIICKETRTYTYMHALYVPYPMRVETRTHGFSPSFPLSLHIHRLVSRCVCGYACACVSLRVFVFLCVGEGACVRECLRACEHCTCVCMCPFLFALPYIKCHEMSVIELGCAYQIHKDLSY